MSISNFGFVNAHYVPSAYPPDFALAAAITGAGAVSVSKPISRFITNGTGNALSLANGTYVGQEICVHVLITAQAHSAILTPTTPLGYATITFGAGPIDDSYASANLVWTGLGWGIAGMSGKVVTA